MPTPALWSSEFRLNATSAGHQYDSRVASLKDGGFVAVWVSQVNAVASIWGQLFDAAGQPRTSEFQINTTSFLSSPSTDLKIETLADGRFVVAWCIDGENPQTTDKDIRARIYNSDATPFDRQTPEGDKDFFVTGTTVAGRQSRPSILAFDNGGFVISYEDYSRAGQPAGADVRSQAFDAHGRATGTPGKIVSPSDLEDQTRPISAALSNGTYIVIYNDASAGGYICRFFGADGEALPNPEIAISENIHIGEPRVDALTNGNFVVTWGEAGDGSGGGIRTKIFAANGAVIKEAFFANSTTTGDQHTADVVALKDGGFAVAYEDYSQNIGCIRLTTFDSSGNRIGEEIRVDAPSILDRYEVRLTALADGRIVVTYGASPDNQDEVYGRIVDARFSAVSVQGTAHDDQYIGTGFGDTLAGAAGSDRLRGEAGNDVLDGGTGADRLDGGLGDDLYRVDSGNDVVTEASGAGRDSVIALSSYTLSADAEVEILQLGNLSSGSSANLTGSDTANEITGHGGANILKGFGGNDRIYGKTGNDKLYGGLGKDMFVFDTAMHKTRNVDKIYDFKSKDDSFWLDNKIFTKIGLGTETWPKKLKSDMFVNGTKAQDREDRIVYDKKTGNLYYDKDGTGGAAQVKIATISNKAKLYFHDFFVV
ncbi:hypothetical protein GR304_15860 [Microvirga sp. SYSU G3D207]|nr:hypothetical protein [Microvirga arsenatis]